jgi:hypothetical protein
MSSQPVRQSPTRHLGNGPPTGYSCGAKGDVQRLTHGQVSFIIGTESVAYSLEHKAQGYDALFVSQVGTTCLGPWHTTVPMAQWTWR